MKPVRAAALALLCATSCGAPAAFEAAPLGALDHSPFGLLYGVPALGPARLLAPGARRVELEAALASHDVDAQKGGEEIVVDGETQRLALRLRAGFDGGYEGTLELARVAHRGGSLDGFIMRWHDFFSLPRGERAKAPRDRLLVVYRRDGVERVALASPAAGTGDARIGLGKSLAGAEDAALALRAELKLPTGASAALAGSGAADLALWASAARTLTEARDWSVYGGGGVAFLGRGDVLPELQRRSVPFAGLGLGWRALPDLALKAQLDAHAALYARSAVAPLGRAMLQLALGGTLRLGRAGEFEFAVLEDLAVGAAPDVTLRAALRVGF